MILFQFLFQYPFCLLALMNRHWRIALSEALPKTKWSCFMPFHLDLENLPPV